MKKEEATIYDFVRMCGKYQYTHCEECPMRDEKCNLCMMDDTELDKANEIILKWIKEHPVKTRQDKFLEMFPNALKNKNGIIDLCPGCINTNIECFHTAQKCAECCKKYWLAEVDENDK